MGDFNFVHDGEDRVSVGDFIDVGRRDSSQATIFENELNILTEIHQSDFTRSGTAREHGGGSEVSGGGKVYSRIDRCYCSLNSAILLEMVFVPKPSALLLLKAICQTTCLWK